MFLNGDATKQNTYDAIVVGSGISGGWAAKELTEKGLKTLVLDRGRMVKHVEDYPTAMKNPWDMPHRGKMEPSYATENPIASKCYAVDEFTHQFFTKDKEQEYVQEKPFDWIRGYHVGGKSLLWARQTQRWSDYDFEGPARDGYATDWPIRYKDLAPWYSHVEKFAGIAGDRDGIDSLPDGEFLPAVGLNCVEKHFQKQLKKHFPDRFLISGRAAHLTKPNEIHNQQGRGQCQMRHLCYRGCPFGGYFSSNSSTLPWAEKTGNLTIRPNAIVESVIYDEKAQKATGVRIIDALTGESMEFYAKIIFVNASCLATNAVLLNSKSSRFENGLGNDNGLLGKYVAFHNYRARISAEIEGFDDTYFYGRRPSAAYIPRFRNLKKQETDFLRGYAIYVDANRSNIWGSGNYKDGFGAEFKDGLSAVGSWSTFVMAMGETIPKETNHIRLSDKKDIHGLPQIIFSVDYDQNDEKMIKDFHEQGSEMLTKSGFKNLNLMDTKQAPGLDIHEMGGCRMGKDPKTSLLNEWNQLHACKNVFVTDGAAMTSTSTQNPSLTYMALTARAVDHAVSELKKQNL